MSDGSRGGQGGGGEVGFPSAFFFFVFVLIITSPAQFRQGTFRAIQTSHTANFPVDISFAVDERDDKLIAGRLLSVGQYLLLRARPCVERCICLRREYVNITRLSGLKIFKHPFPICLTSFRDHILP